MQNKENRIRVNGYIRVPRVKVIDNEGNFLGEMDTWQALKMAQEQSLDLVEINGKSYPITVKIMDFGKFKYEQKKEQAELKKKQKVHEVKELFFHANTESHDLSRQVDQAKEFLADGSKVRFIVKFRGRELSHPEIGREKLLWIINSLKPAVSEFTMPALEGKNMSIMLFPAKSKTN